MRLKYKSCREMKPGDLISAAIVIRNSQPIRWAEKRVEKSISARIEQKNF
jgi:hypothetical protein